MKLLHIPLRNLRLRLLSATLTGASIALGTMLVAFLWIAQAEAKRKYDASALGFRTVVGPTGTSGIDVVLNTVFNVGVPQGTVPLKVYRDLHDDKIHPRKKLAIKHAVPIAVGDNYRGFRVVATTDELFTTFTRGQLGKLEFRAGTGFKFSHKELLELADHLAEHHDDKSGGQAEPEHEHEIPEAWKQVVLGAEVADKLGMKLGDKVVPSHELKESAISHEHDEAACTVVGVLAATGTPIDRAVYLPLGVHYLMQGHSAISELAGKDASSDKARISSIIVDMKSHTGHLDLRAYFRENPVAQAAVTTDEIKRLFEITGNITAALKALAILVMVVAGIGILVALYNTMNDRKREIAIMRSLGARRSHILLIVLIEATFIAAVGGVIGVFGAHLAAHFLSGLVENETGVSVAGAPFTLAELWLVLGTMALGAISGILPAIKASLTGVAENLNPST